MVSVPEATVHEDNAIPRGKDDVWLTYEIPALQAEPEALPMEH